MIRIYADRAAILALDRDSRRLALASCAVYYVSFITPMRRTARLMSRCCGCASRHDIVPATNTMLLMLGF